MQTALEVIIRRFGADTGTIHLVEDGVLALRAHVGVPTQVLQIIGKIPIGKGMAGMATERNEPVLSCDIQVDRTGDVRDGAKHTGVGGAVVVPIRDREGYAVGALGIGVHREHAYCEAEVMQLLEEGTRLELHPASVFPPWPHINSGTHERETN